MCSWSVSRVSDFAVAFAKHACAVMCGIMNQGFAFNGELERFGESFIGREHIGKIRVALADWNLKRVQNTGFWRRFDICHIRMPYCLTVPKVADRRAICSFDV